LACLKHISDVARKGLIELKGGIPSENPVGAVSFLEQQNVRDRALTPEEFQRIVDFSPEYSKPVLWCAYHTRMRRGENWGLTWNRVDLKSGFIRLKESDAKTGEGRSTPIGRELGEVLRRLPVAHDAQGHRVPYVFIRRGQPVKSAREIFARTCQETAITNFVFHDLRHTAPTNLRRAGRCPHGHEYYWA
jgi:integrase